MTSTRMFAIGLAFVATLIIAVIALNLVFDSIALAIGPALAIALAIALAVFLSQRKKV